MKKEIQNVVDRMRAFFYGLGFKSASREIVEKWAGEIEAALKRKKGTDKEKEN